jgi:hypothetical protein
MIYSHPPIYKYCFLFLIIYMFIKHQKNMPPNILLLNTVFILLFVVTVDYILIEEHPYPFVTENDSDLFDEYEDNDDVNDKENNYIDKEIEDIPIYNKNTYDMY